MYDVCGYKFNVNYNKIKYRIVWNISLVLQSIKYNLLFKAS